MTLKLTQKDIALVENFGTPIICGTQRFVLDLKKLTEPIEFVNPKDADNEHGKQILKGDGNDVLLVNNLTSKQLDMLNKFVVSFEIVKGVKPEDMNNAEAKNFLLVLQTWGYKDFYCSDQEYKKKSLTYIDGHVYRLNEDKVCRGVTIPKGTIYADSEKEQVATTEGALFVVDTNGKAMITNEPADYRTLLDRMKIFSYAELQQIQQECLMHKMHGINRR